MSDQSPQPRTSPPLTREQKAAQLRRLTRKYIENLKLFNHTLAETPLAGKYVVFGGLLLGIVREGRPLWGDLDADFYYLEEDEQALLDTIPILLEAGFQKLYRFRANDGVVWEHVFQKDRAKFEFFRARRGEGEQLYLRTFVPMDPPRQQVKPYVHGELQTMEFLDCQWLAPKDLDQALTFYYGDWRTPDRSWRWDRDPLAVGVEPWRNRAEMHWK